MSERAGRRAIRVEGNHTRYSRYVMEQHLGRKLLRSEIVHHINEDPMDDKIENLQVMTRKEHGILHHWTGGQSAANRRYYHKNREKELKRIKKYYQENKERILEYQRKRRQKKRGEKNG